MTVTSKFLCCKYIYLTLSRSASSEVQRCWCSLPTAARVFYSMNIHYIRLARLDTACAVGMDLRIHTSTLGAHADNSTTTPQQWGSFTNNLSGDVTCITRPSISYWCDKVPGVQNSAANRLIGEVVQSRRRPLLGPSPGWKRLLALSHLRHY